MTTHDDKPCPAKFGDVPCGGTMTYQPREFETPPQWVCDTCTRVEVVDDDPGTASMFGEGAD